MSAARATIALITHDSDNFHGRLYLAKLMMRRWERRGLRTVLVNLESGFIPADVALLHVDLSVVPQAYLELADRYPKVLNRRVVDIRKSRFSTLRVDRSGPDPGAVIVKTDCNAGGWPERREACLRMMGESARGPRRERTAYRLALELESRRPLRRRRMFEVGRYPVYAERRFVPDAVWDNPNLVVERFIVERHGLEYYCRHWLFLGNREVCRRAISSEPVVKATAKIEPLADPVPERLRALRDQLGFDYGKFDYGIADGEVVVYDVNRTPGATSQPRRHAEAVSILSEGILDYLEGN